MGVGRVAAGLAMEGWTTLLCMYAILLTIWHEQNDGEKHKYIYVHESVAVGRRVDVISASTMAWWHITMPYLSRE